MATRTSTKSGKRVYAPRMPIAERRAQILDAAVEEYLEKGFTGARVDAIATTIGVSKPVLYGVFDSKEAISAAVVEEVHRREAFALIANRVLDVYEPLRKGLVAPLLENVFEYAAGNPKICRFLYSDFRGAPPEAVDFHEHVFEMRSAGVQFYLSDFFAGTEDGDETAHLISDMISSTGRRGMLQIARGEFDDPTWLARKYGDVIERGIRPA